MAVLAIFRTEGDPEDLLQRYDATLTRATAQAPVRPEAHFCVPTATGVLIVDVWGSREDLRRGVTENSALLAVWREAGLVASSVISSSQTRSPSPSAGRPGIPFSLRSALPIWQSVFATYGGGPGFRLPV